jgi:hypothetical protein
LLADSSATAARLRGPEPMPRAVRSAVTIGIALSLIPLSWLLFGDNELAYGWETRNFYDEQVVAWFDGHWSMPAGVLGIEAWVRADAAQMYFGPAPAVLRVPGFIVADALGWSATGRLTELYMLAGLVLFLAGVGAAWWRARALMCGGRDDSDSTVTTPDLVSVAASIIFLGLGTVVVFLVAFPSVYHEAILWGAGLSLWALLKLVDVARYSRPRDAAWAALLTVAAVQSRASVGTGPMVAAGLLGAVWLSVRCRPGFESRFTRTLAPGLDVNDRRRHDHVLMWLVLTVAVSLASYAAVNHARFGTWFGLPLEQYRAGQIFPELFVAAVTDDYRMFRLAFAPTNLVGYFRTGGLSIGGLPPWVRLTVPEQVGGTPLAGAQPTGSIPSTMPLLVLLGALGVITLLRPGTRQHVVALRAAVIGAAVACAFNLVYMWIAHRFLGDWLPLLVLLGVVGIHRFTADLASPRSRIRLLGRSSAIFVVILLAAWGILVNVAVSWRS